MINGSNSNMKMQYVYDKKYDMCYEIHINEQSNYEFEVISSPGKYSFNLKDLVSNPNNYELFNTRADIENEHYQCFI